MPEKNVKITQAFRPVPLGGDGLFGRPYTKKQLLDLLEESLKDGEFYTLARPLAVRIAYHHKTKKVAGPHVGIHMDAAVEAQVKGSIEPVSPTRMPVVILTIDPPREETKPKEVKS